MSESVRGGEVEVWFCRPSVSLDLLAVDIRQMTKGLKEATAELITNKHNKPLKVRIHGHHTIPYSVTYM